MRPSFSLLVIRSRVLLLFVCCINFSPPATHPRLSSLPTPPPPNFLSFSLPFPLKFCKNVRTVSCCLTTELENRRSGKAEGCLRPERRAAVYILLTMLGRLEVALTDMAVSCLPGQCAQYRWCPMLVNTVTQKRALCKSARPLPLSNP